MHLFRGSSRREGQSQTRSVFPVARGVIHGLQIAKVFLEPVDGELVIFAEEKDVARFQITLGVSEESISGNSYEEMKPQYAFDRTRTLRYLSQWSCLAGSCALAKP